MNTTASSERMANSAVNSCCPQPTSSFAAAPIAERSAPMLMVLAMNSRNTRPVATDRGKTSSMLAARPLPVTRPMRALSDWTATIIGHVSTTVHNSPTPTCAPACE